MKNQTLITATGNAGVHLQSPAGSVFIDAFWDLEQRYLADYRPPLSTDLPADLILVTHSHWDHFSPARVVEAATRTGATVAGPQEVIDQLRGALPGSSLAALEPPPNLPGQPPQSVVLDWQGRGRAAGENRVTAFRTFHGRRHNSYLLRLGGLAIFHDGDNERTQPFDIAALAPVEALLLCPWQGSGWVEFVERLAAKEWLLIHMSDDEIEEHRAGRFLPPLADRRPRAASIVALRPGETMALGK